MLYIIYSIDIKLMENPIKSFKIINVKISCEFKQVTTLFSQENILVEKTFLMFMLVEDLSNR